MAGKPPITNSNLTTYPRPNVAVDVAVLTVLPSGDPHLRPGSLAVLVQERTAPPAGWVVPGRFLREGESIDDCVRTALLDKAAIDPGPVAPRLLRVFDTPGRDPRAWTLSLAHYLVLPPERLAGATGELVPVDDAGRLDRHLLFDHDQIVREAAAAVRSGYELRPDPEGVIDGAFTLAELLHTHEAVLGAKLQRDTFRRRMSPQLAPDLVGEQQATRVDGGRPARLWHAERTNELAEGARRRLVLPRA